MHVCPAGSRLTNRTLERAELDVTAIITFSWEGYHTTSITYHVRFMTFNPSYRDTIYGVETQVNIAYIVH